jgi:type I restriction enzyme, S subunit
MREDWERVCIAEVCESIVDCINKTAPIIDKPSLFKMIRTTNIKNGRVNLESVRHVTEEVYHQWTRRQIPKRGDILLTREAPMGEVGMLLSDEKVFLGQRIVSYRTNPNELDNDFLLYAFQSSDLQNQIKAFASGSTVQHMRVPDTKALQIYLPPIGEQKRIVAIVDQAFEAIDVAIENTKQNLANARELFESYLNDVFTQKGHGWHKRKLEDICTITSKLVDPRQPEFIDLAHVGAGNMTYLTGDLIDVKTAREEELISGKFLFDKTMVLYSKIRPYLMKACRPDFQGLCSADVYPLLPNDGLLNRGFLFHLLMSRNFTDYAIAGSDRAGMPKVNRDHLFRYITWIPSVSEQIKITKKIDKLAAETQRLEAIYRQKLAALTELKQSILQKAFTGELTADQEAP